MKGIKIDLKKIGGSFKTRQVRYGGYAALITLAVIAGLILVNLIMGQLTPQVDLTSNRMFSLSEQTIQVVDSIESPVTIYGLWRPGTERSEVTTTLDLYLARNKNFTLNIVDPERNPGLVRRFDRDNKGISAGSVIVQGPKGFKVIQSSEMYDWDYSRVNYGEDPSRTGVAVERRLTSALLYVATGTTPVVYELTGHNETSMASLGANAFIERENYALKQLDLHLLNIPDDASALILNAPVSDLSPGEAEKLLAYLDKGGRLLVLADYRVQELANLNQVFASYGFRFDYGIVFEMDQTHTVAGHPLLILPESGDHDIVRPLNEQGSTMILAQGMGISELSAKRRSIEFVPFLNTSGNSFLRTDINSINTETVQKIASDVSGPVTMGVTVKDPSYIQGNEPQARIVAISCGALLETAGYYPGNLDLFMNSLTWLEDRPENISVRSKSLFILPMRLNGLHIIVFGLLFVIVIPLALFAGGLVIWLKRRHL